MSGSVCTFTVACWQSSSEVCQKINCCGISLSQEAEKYRRNKHNSIFRARSENTQTPHPNIPGNESRSAEVQQRDLVATRWRVKVGVTGTVDDGRPTCPAVTFPAAVYSRWLPAKYARQFIFTAPPAHRASVGTWLCWCGSKQRPLPSHQIGPEATKHFWVSLDKKAIRQQLWRLRLVQVVCRRPSRISAAYKAPKARPLNGCAGALWDWCLAIWPEFLAPSPLDRALKTV